MKYYKKDGLVYAFESDGSQDDYITNDHVLMNADEIDKHLNPEKYLSDEEKLVLDRQRMKRLSPLEFDLLLVKHGLYDAVQDLIAENRTLKIAYNRAIFFRRLDPFITQAAEALNLSDEQIDELWTSV